jgi:hypothetical protein
MAKYLEPPPGPPDHPEFAVRIGFGRCGRFSTATRTPANSLEIRSKTNNLFANANNVVSSGYLLPSPFTIHFTTDYDQIVIKLSTLHFTTFI